jgi:drug/metabolite transporter (DMT)-like permease
LIAPVASLVRAWHGASPTLRGILLVFCGTFLGATSNSLIRYTSTEIHPFEIVFFRCFFALVFLSPTLFRAGFGSLRTKRFGTHAMRSCVQMGSMLLGFTGFALAPLATATSLQFTAPLFATVLAVVILGEVIRFRRIAALVVGFAGAIIVIQPWQGHYDVGALATIGSAACFAVVMIFIRQLGATEAPTTQLIYLALITTPLTFIIALNYWQTPTFFQLCVMASIGLFTTLNNLTLAHALRLAELSAILPVQYTKLVWAATIGFVVFGEIPDIWTWVGGSLIFGSATYIAIRERKAKPPPPAATA